MAVSVRELLLIVRAQNQASSALKRIGKDIGGLSQGQALRQRGQQLRITEQNLRRERQIAQNRLESLTTGRAAIAQEKAMASHALTTMRAKLAETKAGEELLRNEEQRVRAASQLDRMNQRRLAAKITPSKIDRAMVSKDPDIRRIASAYRAAELQVKRLAIAEGRLAEAAGVASGALSKQAIALRELQAREIAAAQSAELARSRIAGLGNSLALQGQKIRANNKAISDARWDKMAAGGRIIQHAGRVVQYAGLVAGAGLLYAANGAAKFNTQATLVATQAGTVSGNFQEVAKNAKLIEAGILKVMPKSTASIEELNEAAYEIFSSTNLGSQGVKGLNKGMNLLALFSDAAIAGQTNLVKATEAGITIFNSFGKSVDDMPKILNRMFAAVRFGRFTFEQLSASMGQIAPAAVNASQSFDEVAGSIAFLSRHIPQVGMMRAAYARSLEMLNSKDFVDGMKKSGIAVRDATGRMKPLNTVIGDILKKFPQLGRAGRTQKQMIKDVMEWYKETTAEGGGGKGRTGTIQGRRALTFFLGYKKQFDLIRKQVLSANNSFTRSLTAMEQTTGVKWQQMVNQFKAFALMIGQAVIPQLLKLQPYLQKAIDWFNGLDKATKNKYGKWATYAAGIALVTSAFAFLSGVLIKAVANLGKIIGFFPTLILVVAGVTTAVAALSGEWDGLNTIIDSFVSFGTGSLTGWVTMLGLAAGAALKLRSALVGVAAAQAAGGAGGVVGGVMGAGARLKNAKSAATLGKQFAQAERGAGRFAANLAGAGAGLAAMGTAIPVVVGGIALAAGAALLWKRHMDGVARDAQIARNEMAQIKAPQVAAQRFGQLPGAIVDFKQAQLNLKLVNIEIAKTRGSLSKLKGVELQQAQLRLDQLYIDRARSLQNLNTTYNNVRTSVGAFTDYLNRERNAVQKIVNERARLQGLLAQQARTPGTVDTGISDKIDASRKKIAQWIAEVKKAEPAARTAFTKVVTQLQQLDMLPKGISQAMRRAAFEYQKAIGRMLTPADMKKFFTFAMNINTAPANSTMANFFRKWEAKRLKIAAEAKVKAGQVLSPKEILALGRGPLKASVANVNIKPLLKTQDFKKIIASGTKNLNAPVNVKPKGIKPAQMTLAKAFEKPIKQHIEMVKPPNLFEFGASISAGIQAGISAHPVTQAVIEKVIHEPFKRGTETSSPSRWMAREIGGPIVDGIVVGIVKNQHKIEAVAALTASLFSGAWIQALESKQETDPLKLAELEAKSIEAAKKAAKKGATELQKIRAQQAAVKFQKAGGRVDIKDLIKDTRMQATAMKAFNDGLARLAARKVPKALLDQLAELGVDGVKYIKILANASPKELKKFVAAFQAMQKQVGRSKRITVEDIKNMSAEVKKALEDMADEVGQRLADMWVEMRDEISGQFGELFSNIDPATYGKGFEDAMSSWNDTMSGLQDQMNDLNEELADLQQERAKIIADYNKEVIDIKAEFIAQQVEKLQGAFGELFGGEYLQARKEWAAALKFTDIQRDLDEQLKKFTDWRKSLADAAARGIPAGLLKQLEELGPEGLQMIQLLASGTDEELSKYIATWQESQTMFQSIAQQQAATSDELAAQLADALQRFTETMENMNTRMNDVLGKINDVAKEMRKVLAEMPQQMTSQTILQAIQAQIDAWKTYEATLQTLKDRGVPLEVIEQLRKLGVDALPFLQGLVAMTDTELLGEKGFVAKWKEAQALITESTNKHMADQITMWTNHGRDIAIALISGVHSQQQALVSYFRDMFMSLLKGYLPTYNPPPVPPSGGGTTTTGSTTTGSVGPLDPWAAGALGGGSRSFTGTTVNMTVNAVQDESLMSTINTASFNLANRNIP